MGYFISNQEHDILGHPVMIKYTQNMNNWPILTIPKTNMFTVNLCWKQLILAFSASS